MNFSQQFCCISIAEHMEATKLRQEIETKHK